MMSCAPGHHRLHLAATGERIAIGPSRSASERPATCTSAVHACHHVPGSRRTSNRPGDAAPPSPRCVLTHRARESAELRAAGTPRGRRYRHRLRRSPRSGRDHCHGHGIPSAGSANLVAAVARRGSARDPVCGADRSPARFGLSTSQSRLQNQTSSIPLPFWQPPPSLWRQDRPRQSQQKGGSLPHFADLPPRREVVP